jgi:hypothetical protein
MLKILNASPGFGASLSEQDLKEFLTTRVLNLHLGTVDEKGYANVHPLYHKFYECDRFRMRGGAEE